VSEKLKKKLREEIPLGKYILDEEFFEEKELESFSPVRSMDEFSQLCK
jgi:hypothetical protein